MAVIDTTMKYGNGVNSTYGQNSKVFFWDKAGIRAATRQKVYQQFTNARTMPLHTGQQYRISIYHNVYDRLPFTDDTWNDMTATKQFSDTFTKYGYLSSRDISDVNNTTWGTDGRSVNGDNNGARLQEGETFVNQISIKKSTITTDIHEFGRVITYTKETEMFSEDYMETEYRRQLGEDAGQLYEDLVQQDLLATPFRLFAGAATSIDTLGTGIGVGTPDAVTLRNATEESYKINYEMLQRAAVKLKNNRCPKRTSILTGSDKIGTTPVPAAHYAIIPNNISIDLENCVRGVTYEKKFAFTRAEYYASQTTLAQGEIGSMHEFRFITSESAVVYRAQGAIVDDNYIGSLSWNTNTAGEKRFDVYPILVVGPDSFSTISLMGHGKIKFNHIRADQVDKVDSFGKTGFFSYSFWYGALITRPERVLNMLVLGTE